MEIINIDTTIVTDSVMANFDITYMIEYGLKALPPIVSLVVGVGLWLLIKYKEPITAYLISGDFGTKRNLLNHDLFTLINRIINVTVKDIEFENEITKTSVFKDFIIIKLNAISELSRELLKNINLSKISNDELTHDVKETITNIVVRYNDEAKTLFIKKGMTPQQADHVLSIFNKWHKDTLDAVYSRVDNTLTSAYYRTAYAKLVAVLEIFAMAVELTISDGVRSFKELNGYFKNINYEDKNL